MKICYIVSDVNKSVGLEWVCEKIAAHFDLSVVLLNNKKSAFEEFLNVKRIPVTRIEMGSGFVSVQTIFKLLITLRSNKPDIVHCHLLKGAIYGLFASYILGIRKRIYTRHHSTYHHDYAKSGVLIDKVINWLSSDIVAISENVRKVLKYEGVGDDKIKVIHHGFKIEKFREVNAMRTNELAKKYGISMDDVKIGVVARWIEWKGIEYIIFAFELLLKAHPNAKLILCNCSGPYRSKIERALIKLPKQSFYIIPFEEDIFSLYKIFDIYIHVPIDGQIEAFGQTYIESLASGLPSVFTKSGVAHEFIEHGVNALVVPYKNSNSIVESILALLGSPEKAGAIARQGSEDIEQFSFDRMFYKLQDLYT